jgi:sugar (pentulose or hexulose) kinase
MADDYYLAFDLGAGSIRVMLGRVDKGHLEIIPLPSTPNEIVNIEGSLHWDVLSIYSKILQGMALCAANYTESPVSIGIDTWGIDFGLLDAWGNLIGAPYCYRDRRTRGVMQEVFQMIPKARLHELTGLESRPIHTIFQLYSMVRDKGPQLEIATDLLFMPDIFNYFLTGNKKASSPK